MSTTFELRAKYWIRLLLAAAFFLSIQLPTCAEGLKAEDVSGIWDITLETEEGTAHPSLNLRQEGEKITGTYQGRMGNVKLEGTITGVNIRFVVNLKFQDVLVPVTYTGTVDGDTMKGSVRFGGGGTGSWSAKRRKSQG